MAYMTDWQLIKNPGSLSSIGEFARGVILANGDLYLENFSSGTIHNDILRILFSNGIINGTFKSNWTKKTPDSTDFLTVQRFAGYNVICIGESNRNLYSKVNYQEKIHLYLPFLKRAAENNSEMEFADKLIKIKAPFTGDREYVTYIPKKNA